jgi:cell wall-associated NlpC family hydrolase
MGERYASGISADAGGESMATDRQDQRGPAGRTRPWWRPLLISTAVAAAIVLLFNPLPAAAAPGAPLAPANAAVPDSGSRPIALGTLVMPGQAASPSAIPVASNLTTTPVVAKRDKMTAEIATLGDKLIQFGQDRDRAQQQLTAADQKVANAQTALAQAHEQASVAAANSLRDAAALPPGMFGSGLQDLDALARMQRGDTVSDQAAARQLALAQAGMTDAQAEQATAGQLFNDLSTQYNTLNATIATKQAALQKYEKDHAAELSQADAAENAQDQQLGAQYLAGASAGRGADPRALAAVNIALAQRGDPYVWSEEGPDEFDCSGLMYYAYHSPAAGSFPLARVSRDQYLQTDQKVVDRYSLVPGDLLFFSYSNSWTGIHHVAMYVGNGMMVEAPRTGLNVRLTPVRWTRLFQATRIYGSVEGTTTGPDLNHLPPPASHSATPTPTPSKTTKPPTTPTTKPTTGPTTGPPTTAPTTAPTTTSPTTTPTTATATKPADPPSSTGTTPTGGTSGSSPSDSQSQSAATSASASSSNAASSSSSASGTASAGTK